MKVILFLLTTFFFSFNSLANNGFKGITNYSIGMVSVGVTENESTLVQTDTDVEESGTKEAASTSASAISFNASYEFSFKQKRSYFVKGTVPMMTSDGSGLFLGGIGFNWYLNDLGSIYVLNMNGNEIRMIPKFRYWWGASTGVGYLVYNTENAKKSDVIFDLAVHAGAGYSFSEKWGMRGEAIVGRGTGVATSTMNIRIFFGAVYSI